jgi:hypothetical protein
MLALPAGGLGGLKKKGARKKRQHGAVVKAALRYIAARADELADLKRDSAATAVAAVGAVGADAKADPLPEQLKQQQQQASALLQRHKKELEDLLAGFQAGEAAAVAAAAAIPGGGGGAAGATPAAATGAVPYNMDLARLRPQVDIAAVPWDACVGVKRSDEGTDGVLFVELPDNRCVCVKSPGSITAEVYGAWMAKRLGVPTPSLRLVNRNSDEGQKIIAALTSERVCGDKTGSLRGKVERVVLRPFLLVMQFVKGVPLDYAVQGSPFCVQFLLDKFGEGANMLHATGVLNCRILGRVLALDVLTNNFDRLPCIWNNKGNAGNVLFQGEVGAGKENCLALAEPHTAIGIDNMVSCIDVAKFPEQHNDYVGKTSTLLRGLLAEAFPGTLEEEQGGGAAAAAAEASTGAAATGASAGAGFERVRDFLRDGTQDGGWPGTGFDVGQAGLEEIQQGFLRCMAAFASIPKGELEDVKDTLHETFKDAMTEHCTWGLERIHPEFILRIAAALHEVADESKFMDAVDGFQAGSTGGNDAVAERAGKTAAAEAGQAYVAEPDLSLLPRSNTMHRRQQNRLSSQKNLASLNEITSCAELQVMKPFAMCGVGGAGTDETGAQVGANDENTPTPVTAAKTAAATPVTSPKSPPRGDGNNAATMASPALLRRLAQQQQDEKKSGVCIIS